MNQGKPIVRRPPKLTLEAVKGLASFLLCGTLGCQAYESDSSCAHLPIGQNGEQPDAPQLGMGRADSGWAPRIAELSFRFSTLVNPLTLATSTYSIAVNAGWDTVTFSEGETSMPVVLSPDEGLKLAEQLGDPGLLQFMQSPLVPCGSTAHGNAYLEVQLEEREVPLGKEVLTCLQQAEAPDLGQLTYEAVQLHEFLVDMAEQHLDCPHPGNLEDGLPEMAPVDLSATCGVVWNRLSRREDAKCAAGHIAEGVWDCFE